MNIDLLIWTFPLAFFLHNLEEIFTMERFARENRVRFPKLLQRLVPITTAQFTAAVVVLLVLALLASLLATRSPRDMTLFTIGMAIFFLHVFTHVAQVIVFRQYTPGVITAVLVVLPYSLYVFHRLFIDRLISEGDFTTSLLIGAVLAVPIILGVRQLGEVFTRFMHR